LSVLHILLIIDTMYIKSQCLTTPPAFYAPLWGPRRHIVIRFGTEKLEWCGYPTVERVWWYV